MCSLEQDVNIASYIYQDAVYPAIGDLYWDYHKIIMGLNCIVDIFICENDPSGTERISRSIVDFEYLMTGIEPWYLPGMILSQIVRDSSQGKAFTNGMDHLDLLHQIIFSIFLLPPTSRPVLTSPPWCCLVPIVKIQLIGLL